MTDAQPLDATGRPTLAPATLAVSLGRGDAEPDAPVNPPVVLSSTFRASPGAAAPGDRVYARWSNPTWEAVEETLGGLEGGRALLFSSGMAAIAAVLDGVPLGSPVVAPRSAYSGLLQLLRALEDAGRLSVRWVDVSDTDATVTALPGAALLWVETPTNPLLQIADLPALVRACRDAGVALAVDNTFATPLGLRPLDFGADVVVHSVTKYLAGHSDVVLGAVVVADDDRLAPYRTHRTLHGAIPGPLEAWLALRGIRTLALRTAASQANAAELARRLQGHPAVARVRHPSLPDHPHHERARDQMRGFGSIVSIELGGGAEAAERFASSVRLWLHATSLGGVESSLERRRRQAAESPEVPEALVRLSVGIEDVEDLWEDLRTALDAASG